MLDTNKYFWNPIDKLPILFKSRTDHFVQGRKAQRRSEKANRITAWKAEMARVNPEGGSALVDEDSGIWLLHWLGAKPCSFHLCGPLNKSHWTPLAHLILTTILGGSYYWWFPFYRSRDRLKKVNDLPRFIRPLINGEQTLGENKNISIIESDICPCDIWKYSGMFCVFWKSISPI